MAAKPGRYGWATPIECGRKFCAECGRWRHVSDFLCRERLRDGSALLTTRCGTCLRLEQRRIYARKRHRESRREYQRIWTEGRRREAGVPARNWGPRSRRTETVLQRIPLQPFKEAIEKSPLTRNGVAALMGMDSSQFDRMLEGDAISYRNATRVVRALGLDPVDLGV